MQRETLPTGLGRRVGARLADGALIAIPVTFVLGLLGVEGPGFEGEGWLAVATTAVLWFVYGTWSEAVGGATFGKKLLDLRVVADHGRGVPLAAAAKRNGWLLIGAVPVAGPLLVVAAVAWLLLSMSPGTDAPAYHDRLAGTSVVRASSG